MGEKEEDFSGSSEVLFGRKGNYNLNEGNVNFDHGLDGKIDAVEDSPKRRLKRREMTQRQEGNVRFLRRGNGLERTAGTKERYWKE